MVIINFVLSLLLAKDNERRIKINHGRNGISLYMELSAVMFLSKLKWLKSIICFRIHQESPLVEQQGIRSNLMCSKTCSKQIPRSRFDVFNSHVHALLSKR